ncbi:MAG: DUF3526 domain-containing protein [Pseudomonadota bacterium]
MLGFHFIREWRSLWTTPLRLAAILFLLAVSIWSVVDGLRWYDTVQATQAKISTDAQIEQGAWFADLAAATAGETIAPSEAQPINLERLALRSPAPLSPLAHSREALFPHTALASGWRSEASLFRRYEVQGPTVLTTGRMDLLFVITVFLPLILLLLTFDVLSQERQAGRARMSLIQGWNPARHLLARLAATAIPVTLIPIGCIFAVAFITAAPWIDVGVWAAIVLVHVFFWSAIAALIAVLFRRPISGALSILACWSVLVVLIPSGVQFLAQALYPVPSRVTYLAEAREAEGQTRRNVEQRAELFMAEHVDEIDVPIEGVPGFYRRAYLANIDVNAGTAPILIAFETQQARQRRLVDVAQFLSPTLATKTHLEQVSATGAEQAALYRAQARDYLGLILETVGPATVARSRMYMDEARAVPSFTFVPRSPGVINWLGILASLMIGMTLVPVALRRARFLS